MIDDEIHSLTFMTMSQPEPTENQLADVRMRGFVQRSTVNEVLSWIDQTAVPLTTESVPLSQAAGRVLAEHVQSNCNVPGFKRSMMDGYAVIADQTLGATPYQRLQFDVSDESLPGRPASRTVERGTAVRIMTGAPLPAGADAVLPAELTEVDGNRIWIQGEVSPGKHVGGIGEDVAHGNVVLEKSRILRPQDVGVLSSVGVAEVPVVRQPTIRIVVTGDELLPSGTMPSGFQITDANGPMLRAFCERDGGIPNHPGIVADRPASIREAMHEDVDVVLVSGGSSVGQEDHAPVILAEDGELRFHGVAMRPSSPTGMGRLEHRLVFLLPGNPVSCLCAYDFFAGRAIRILGGRNPEWPYRKIYKPLRRKLVSAVGRVDYGRVRLENDELEPLAISGASVLSTTTRADGFVVVPADSEGYAAGTVVEVWLYDA